MKYEPKLVFYSGATLLEGPVWNEERQEIVCVSIEQNCIYLIDVQIGCVKTYHTNGQVGCAVFKNKDCILAATYNGLYEIDVNTEESIFITQLIQDKNLRYNDGKLDSCGRLLVGTTGYKCLAENKNFLYSWDGSQCRELITGTTISNGIDFSKDDKWMYFVDTPTKKVGRYRYDINTGDAVFDKYIIEITDKGVPDGICLDDDGMLWVAQWGGSKVSKWNPDSGEKLDEILLPCLNVTSCCVGGKDRDMLYITTAQHDDGTESELMAGGLFAVKIR